MVRTWCDGVRRLGLLILSRYHSHQISEGMQRSGEKIFLIIFKYIKDFRNMSVNVEFILITPPPLLSGHRILLSVPRNVLTNSIFVYNPPPTTPCYLHSKSRFEKFSPDKIDCCIIVSERRNMFHRIIVQLMMNVVMCYLSVV